MNFETRNQQTIWFTLLWPATGPGWKSASVDCSGFPVLPATNNDDRYLTSFSAVWEFLTVWNIVTAGDDERIGSWGLPYEGLCSDAWCARCAFAEWQAPHTLPHRRSFKPL